MRCAWRLFVAKRRLAMFSPGERAGIMGIIVCLLWS